MKTVEGRFQLASGNEVIYSIDCYGDLQDNSNFSVVCEDEEFDEVWCDGNPNSKDYTFASWEEVCEVLTKYFPDIVQIEAG